MRERVFGLRKSAGMWSIVLIGIGMWFASPSLAQRDPYEIAQAAFLARNSNQFPLAIRLFDQALAQGRFEDRQRGLILYGRGVSYDALGSHDRALADLDAAVALLPDSAEVHLYRGIIWGDKGAYSRALQDFLMAAKLNPGDPFVFVNLGKVYERLGDLDRAIDSYNHAIGLGGDDPNAYYNRAHAYVLRDDNERALADYNKAIVLQPNFKDAFVDRAIVHVMRRDITKALTDLDTAIGLDPRDINARANRATVNWGIENYEAALSDFNQALVIRPGDAALYLRRGQTHLFAGDIELSIADFLVAVRIRPTNPYPAIWLHIARVHKGEDDREEVLGNAQNVKLDVWPSAVLNLYIGSQSMEDVLAAAQKGRPVEKAERVCEAKFFIGEFAFHKSEMRQAREAFSEVISTCGPQEGIYGAAVAESKLIPKP